MLYAAIIACTVAGCWGVTDDLGPYETAEACEARLHEMRQAVAQHLGHQPGFRASAICGPVDEVRRLIPGAFPGVAAEVEA